MRWVILAETVPLFRYGVRSTLECSGGWSVLEGTNQTEILELAQLHQPDCAILDSTANTFDALETCWMLRQQVPTVGLLILTDAPNEEQFFRYILHGANAYERRSIVPERLIDRVQRVSCGEYLLGSELLVSRAPARTTPDREMRSRRKVVASGAQDAPNPSPLSD